MTPKIYRAIVMLYSPETIGEMAKIWKRIKGA